MERRQEYPFDLSVENENVKKTFNVLNRERGFGYPRLLQKL